MVTPLVLPLFYNEFGLMSVGKQVEWGSRAPSVGGGRCLGASPHPPHPPRSRPLGSLPRRGLSQAGGLPGATGLPCSGSADPALHLPQARWLLLRSAHACRSLRLQEDLSPGHPATSTAVPDPEAAISTAWVSMTPPCVTTCVPRRVCSEPTHGSSLRSEGDLWQPRALALPASSAVGKARAQTT